MVKLQAPPNHAYYVGSSVYRAGPWKRTAAPTPAPESAPTKPQPPKVPLKAPRPHMTFAPDPDHSTVRYTANADGHFEQRPST